MLRMELIVEDPRGLPRNVTLVVNEDKDAPGEFYYAFSEEPKNSTEMWQRQERITCSLTGTGKHKVELMLRQIRSKESIKVKSEQGNYAITSEVTLEDRVKKVLRTNKL